VLLYIKWDTRPPGELEELKRWRRKHG
jgi:hypothetical protein